MPRDSIAVLEEVDDRALHVHVDSQVNRVILKRADHLETGAVADVREPRIFVSAEISLEDAPIGRPIEDSSPRLELTHAIRRFLRVKLRHSPVVHVLAAAHRIGEMHSPVVAVVDVGERCGDAAFGHHRVRLAEQRLAHEPYASAGICGFDRCAKSRASGAYDENVVTDAFRIAAIYMILKSVHTPIESRRT